MVNLNDSDPTITPEKTDFIPPEEVAASAEPALHAETTNHSRPNKKDVRTGNRIQELLAGYWRYKKWTIPVTFLAVVAVILAVPSSRYFTLGLFFKSNVAITVVDSKTGEAVSSAVVTLSGTSLKTNSDGQASGNVKLGRTQLGVTKQYYSSAAQSVTVTMSKTHNHFRIGLSATGRQVPITITDKISGKPIAGALVRVLSTESTTTKAGTTTIVLPTTASSQKAILSVAGYNQVTTMITITDQVIAANTFQLTPAGKVYFLSNQTGTIDVVKANLDGSDRQTVLPGTGSEDPNNTSLLAARDWKYLALVSKRAAGGNPAIQLLDTSTDKLTNIDQGNADFTPVGWDNDSFVYLVNRNGFDSWQPNATSLKSFNAQTGKLTTLDSTKATGSSNYDAHYEALFANNVHFVGDTIVYAKIWYAYPGYTSVAGEQNTLNSTTADGSGKKTVATQDAATNYFGTLFQYSPLTLLVQVSSSNATTTAYYQYASNGSYSADTDTEDIAALQSLTYTTYLASPSGKQTLWSEVRDGKNALFLGDQDAKNAKQISSLSEYTQYGWYTDGYLLVSRNSSELAIMPADGNVAPQKISDYYKPPITYNGYGGGYGGL